MSQMWSASMRILSERTTFETSNPIEKQAHNINSNKTEEKNN